MNLSRAFFVAVAATLLANYSIAQFHYRFKTFTTDDGLSDGRISRIIEDETGLMWIGAHEGISRFDGYSFKPYAIKAADMLLDSDGVIWAVSESGLYSLDTRTEKIQGYSKGIDSLKISMYMQQIVEDDHQQLWISTYYQDDRPGGLVCFNKQTGTFSKYQGKNPYVSALIKDDFGNIWCGGDVFQIFDPVRKTFLDYSLGNRPDITLEGHHIAGFSRAGANTIWAGTARQGAVKIKYDSNYRLIRDYITTNDPRFEGSLLEPYARFLTTDRDGRLWIGSAEGTACVDEKRKTITTLIHKENSIYAPPKKDENIIYQDKNGAIWIGYVGALSVLEPNKGFIVLDPAIDAYSKLKAFDVSSILYDRDKNLWITTYSGWLQKIKLKPDYSAIEDVQAFKLPEGRLSSLSQDHNGTVWSAHSNGGMIAVPEGMWKIIRYPQPGYASAVMEYRPGEIWIHTWGTILRVEKQNAQQFAATPLLPDPTIHPSKAYMVSKMLKDKERVWVSTFSGEMYVYDSKVGAFYLPEVISDKGPDDYISEFTISSSGDIWTGTRKGIRKYRVNELQDGKLQLVLTKSFNDSSHSILRPKTSMFTNVIQEDHHGNMWIGQLTDLFHFINDGEQIVQYSKKDGLPFHNTTFHASTQLDNGYLAFGSEKGIYLFHPDSLKKNSGPPRLVFTDLMIDNRPPNFGVKDSVTNFLLEKQVSYVQRIQVPYAVKIIEIGFSALDFVNPELSEYSYKLEGFDRGWVNTHRHSATYTNLDPGHYTFVVRGANSDGVWNNEGIKLSIVVLPPWWKTWWAYLSYAFVFIVLLFVARQQIVRRERLKNVVRMKSLEAEKLHQIDSLKSKLFANISHEFRTPLTLLLAPLERRLREARDAGEKHELELMRQSTNRLLTLVNQLLDLSRLESGAMTVNVGTYDFEKFFRVICAQFSSVAESKEITFHQQCQAEGSWNFDADKLEKMLVNLLSNAFKFTPAGGTVVASASVDGPNLVIKVVDTGIGIRQVHLAKIFDRFYQADDGQNRKYEGTGIGLSLVKEFAELHGGTVTVESEPGNGSTFTLLIPSGLAVNAVEQPFDHSTRMIWEDHGHPQAYVADGPESLPKILIVEDNPDLRHYFLAELGRRYSVSYASDGELGWKLALDEIPDVILSDLMMPNVDGFEFSKRIRENPKTSHIPIILLTARADRQTRLTGLKIGVDDYMSKPFDFTELILKVDNLIESRKKLREKYATTLALKPSDIKAVSMEEKFLKTVVTIIEKNIANENFSVEELARDIAMSSVQLYRKLKAITGNAPVDVIRNMRLDRAKLLLQQRTGNVAEVAYAVGFSNLSYFAKCFKERFGVTPSEFLKTVHPELPK